MIHAVFKAQRRFVLLNSIHFQSDWQ